MLQKNVRRDVSASIHGRVSRSRPNFNTRVRDSSEKSGGEVARPVEARSRTTCCENGCSHYARVVWFGSVQHDSDQQKGL